MKYTVFTFGCSRCRDCLTSSSSLATDIELQEGRHIMREGGREGGVGGWVQYQPVLREECAAKWCGKCQAEKQIGGGRELSVA